MTSLFLGLFLGLIGIDELTGQERLTFGVQQLLDGLDVVVVAVGLFAVGEALYVAARMRHDTDEVVPVRGRVGMNREEWGRSWKSWLRGTLIGFPFGTLPAGGAEIPTFISYNVEKRLSRHEDQFGEGAIEGVAGPEAANNAAFSGVLVPLLTLGIPTSATAAILLAAFQIFNLQPGPLLFERSSGLVWTLIASLYIGNVMLLILNYPLIRIWVKLLAIPKELLYAGILLFATLGVYSLSNSVVDLLVMYAIGVLGFFMRRYDFPVGPRNTGLHPWPPDGDAVPAGAPGQPGRPHGLLYEAPLAHDSSSRAGGAPPPLRSGSAAAAPRRAPRAGTDRLRRGRRGLDSGLQKDGPPATRAVSHQPSAISFFLLIADR